KRPYNRLFFRRRRLRNLQGSQDDLSLTDPATNGYVNLWVQPKLTRAAPGLHGVVSGQILPGRHANRLFPAGINGDTANRSQNSAKFRRSLVANEVSGSLTGGPGEQQPCGGKCR